MSHKNILKLIGCCLETQAPIIPFEHVEYETLADRIYRSCEPHFEPLLLTYRLKIAIEIANAIAYLHSGFPRPIVFKLINQSTIVFNEQYVAKLFDFSVSMSIPEGETHVKYKASRKFEFVAPECGWTGKFNEKLDVYRFGTLLLVLLTGRKMINTFEDEYYLEGHVKKCIEQNIHPIIVGIELSPEKEQLLLAFT
ncbi:non-functional pseudokinase ZED1-like [Pistacia vera]|uniref:non-functional pseudokinase ZED1-like n=1 Tax=Pistacia vera TaxID=55513 RepID=UPI0012631009|nr:non-functional pseudokinase ZED1-like [Pistacia vera]